jgi:hypothetical protein
MSKHVHNCPMCHADEECDLAPCTIEPDLGVTPAGLRRGYPDPCTSCGVSEADGSVHVLLREAATLLERDADPYNRTRQRIEMVDCKARIRAALGETEPT